MQETWIQSWVGKFPWRREWQPTPAFLPGKFHGQRTWQATVHGVAKSQTWLNDWSHSTKKKNTDVKSMWALESSYMNLIQDPSFIHLIKLRLSVLFSVLEIIYNLQGWILYVKSLKECDYKLRSTASFYLLSYNLGDESLFCCHHYSVSSLSIWKYTELSRIKCRRTKMKSGKFITI